MRTDAYYRQWLLRLEQRQRAIDQGVYSGPLTLLGNPPLTVTGANVVTNLNADQVDGKHAADFVLASEKNWFGNKAGGDYAEFGADGTLRLYGAATTYDDLRIDGLSTRTGVTAPTDETGFRGDGNFYSRNFVHTQADEVQFAVQLPHAWKEGGLLYPHVHFSPWIAGAGNRAAQFVLEYYWANVWDQFPASPSTHTMTKTWSTDQQWYHLIASNAAPLTATGKTLSSMLKCRLYRDNTVANNLAGKVALLYIDFHVEIDALGSREEYSK